MYDRSAEEKCFKEYLEILTFSELIAESNEVMRELRKGNISKELTFRSRLILKEFELRIGSTPRNEKISEIVENNILNLSDHLQQF